MLPASVFFSFFCSGTPVYWPYIKTYTSQDNISWSGIEPLPFPAHKESTINLLPIATNSNSTFSSFLLNWHAPFLQFLKVLRFSVVFHISCWAFVHDTTYTFHCLIVSILKMFRLCPFKVEWLVFLVFSKLFWSQNYLLSPTNFAIKILGSSKLETRFKKFIKLNSSLLNFF
jgi:hypothetical protein